MITAIVTHYYPERIENLKPILTALLNSFPPLDEIIVWNNSPHQEVIPESCKDEKVFEVHSTRNLGCGSWFNLVPLAKGFFIYKQDDDLMIDPGTIVHMLRCLAKHYHMQVNVQGRRLAQDSDNKYHYHGATLIDGRRITQDEHSGICIGLGRALLTRKQMLLAAFNSMELGRHEFLAERMATDDDIMLSYYLKTVVCSLEPGKTFKDLSEHGRGISLLPGHWDRREALVQRLWND